MAVQNSHIKPQQTERPHALNGRPPRPPLPPPQATPAVRRYCPDRDHADVAYICRNVYGGTDELPLTINAAAAQPGTHILTACTGGHAAPLDAVLCCQQRGDVLWLWGARTREERRGNGLARLLLEEAEALARQLPGVAALLSVTVPANETMRRMFARQGFSQQCDIISWPASEVSRALHRRLLELGPQQQPPPTMLSLLPETAAIASSPAAVQLLPSWRRCRSAEQLASTLLLLRQWRTREQVGQVAGEAAEQLGRRTQGAPAPLAATSHAFAWLPGEYEVVPAASRTVQQLLERGDAWLLEAAAPGAEGEQQAAAGDEQAPAAAVLVQWGPGFAGVRRAGIVAGSAAALESALLLAADADPHCCRFYVDCCGRFEHSRLWDSTAGERYDILPYYKPL